jgi:ferredoxin
MRLDWYLPVIRRPNDKIPRKHRGWWMRTARRWLPASWFSDWHTKQRGRLRRWLRIPGLSWVASPVRRVCQSVCFVAFLVLFFHVCWPYDARPSRNWNGFIPAAIDPDTGVATVAADIPVAFDPETRLFVTDAGLPADDPDASLGWFLLKSISAEEAVLTPERMPNDTQLETLLLSFGPWTLSEQDPSSWPSHYADNLARKESVAAEFFLVIDPLVSVSTAIASRSWVWSLSSAGIILLVCLVIPRGFCGYICPLGTLIDLFDTVIGRRTQRLRIPADGWWVHIKYFLLLAILVAAGCGVLLSGMFAAIPVITRGLLFTVSPLQNGWANGWHQVPPLNSGHVISIVLFIAVLGLGFLRPRFWCRYVCPSGAVFSLGNLFRVTERKVESSCIHCNKCVEICPFDAIKSDFTTRTTDCTLCETCAGVCPTHAIKFVGRWEIQDLKPSNEPPVHETAMGRRGFVSAIAGTLTGVAAGLCSAVGTSAFGARLSVPGSIRPVRPPGSVPEQEFLEMCIRCGECFKACPSDVLQPLGFEQGLEGLWTPQVVANWSGCASSCNACGQVCPTGAIRALPLQEKKAARMGLAVVNEFTCLPFAEREACQLCVDECHAAGYHAIEFTQVGTEVDTDGTPIEGTGWLAPVVLEDKCVGCGLCQTRCHGINVNAKHVLKETAIIIEAGAGKEDRMMTGSYIARHESQH